MLSLGRRLVFTSQAFTDANQMRNQAGNPRVDSFLAERALELPKSSAERDYPALELLHDMAALVFPSLLVKVHLT